jgi:hypothetical protein
VVVGGRGEDIAVELDLAELRMSKAFPVGVPLLQRTRFPQSSELWAAATQPTDNRRSTILRP